MISIVTPVLNGEKFIEKNIKSIQQLKIPYEHIIVDGGSTDETIDIVKRYPHLILLHQKEKTGMYGGIDMGFKEAKGDYIGWVNCDDEILPDSFGEMYIVANKRDWDFVNSDSSLYYINVGKDIKIKGTRYASYFLKKGIFPFVQPSSLYKISLYIRVGGFNTELKIAGDMDLFYRMAHCENTTFGYFPGKTTTFIKYGNSLGDQNSEKAYQERLSVNIPNPTLIVRFLYKLSKIL